MGIAKKLKQERRKARNDFRSVAEAPCFFVAAPNGSPGIVGLNVSGRTVQVASCFSTADEARKVAEEQARETGLDLTFRNMPVGTFLSGLLHHLYQDDIDVLLTDGDTPYPLTTMGVNVLQFEQWRELLEQARQRPDKNPLLVRVIREVLGTMVEADGRLALQGTDDDTLIRGVMGKHQRLPTVDMGLVWVLSALEKGAVPEANVPETVSSVFLRLKDKEDVSEGNLPSFQIPPGEELIIGPLVFSERQKAIEWAKILPGHVALHLANLDLRLNATRASEFIGEQNEGFPNLRPETLEAERWPDVLILDGGLIPLTPLGAEYADAKTDWKEFGLDGPPEKTWGSVARDEGVEIVRNMALNVTAKDLKVQFVRPEEPSDAETSTEPQAPAEPGDEAEPVPDQAQG